MFKPIFYGNSLPMSLPVDPSAEFLPGMIAQANVIGNNIVYGVSDGTAPFGIIDDIKTKAFTAPSIDEEVIVPAVGVPGPDGQLVTPIEIKKELRNPNIIPSSFTVYPIEVELIPRNGVIVFPEGTPLNFDLTGGGQPDAIRVVVSYTYHIPNVPGDDSTLGSNRVTIWFQRMIAETDQFETNQRYPLNAPLFVNESGLLTTRQPTPNHPGVGMVIAPPTSISGQLQFLWL